jgi:7-cyano-7-deazaguanine tRNA-ribosyltransferase
MKFNNKDLYMIFMIEIKQHDGPARLGKYGKLESPAVLTSTNSIQIIKDEPMPFDVPKALARWSVDQTVENAEKSNENGFVVIHGAKYLDLRIECAQKLDELGYTNFLIANTEELIRRPRDLVNIMVTLRERVNPNVALYFPFAEPVFLPLLVYMGVDLFGCFVSDFYACLNIMLTQTTKYDLKQYHLSDFNLNELAEHNKGIMKFLMKEIRENIKNGTLRNLVEQRCCGSPEAMSALRILDRDYSRFLKKFTPLY